MYAQQTTQFYENRYHWGRNRRSDHRDCSPQIGINVSIYEAHQELRPAGAGIALAANAVKAFELLGLRDKILAHGNPFELFFYLR